MNVILFFAYAMINLACCLASKVEERSKFKAADFKFDLDGLEPSKGAGGGDVRRVFVDQFPALAGEKLSFGLFDILPCGVNLPHIHPRAAELVYVTDKKIIILFKLNDFILRLFMPRIWLLVSLVIMILFYLES
jgi:hypothetical protein